MKYTIILLISFLLTCHTARSATDTTADDFSPRIIAEVDVAGIPMLALWPNASIYRFEAGLEYLAKPKIGLRIAGGRGGFRFEKTNINLHDHFVRGNYLSGSVVFGNLSEQKTTFYGSMGYIFSSFTTTGKYVIKHEFWDDFVHPLDAGKQNLHGFMMEGGLRIHLSSRMAATCGIGATFPIAGKNLIYRDEFSALQHRYTPGAGYHSIYLSQYFDNNIVMKMFVRLSFGRFTGSQE